MTASSLLPPFSLADATDATRFGAKAANLAWLHRHGAPAVHGVALDAAWLDAHLAQGEGTALLQQLRTHLARGADESELAACAERLGAWIVATELLPGMREQLQRTMQRFEPGAWVVRSSAIGEDSANASFAGQLDSALHCHTLEDVEHALRRVWASAFSPHCLAYQQHSGQRLAGVGVVVCMQVQAAFAGVLFSDFTAPSGEQCLLIEYTQGLADGLVSGAVTPAQAWFGRVHGELRAHEAPERGGAQLPNAVLAELAERGRRLERRYGGPVDLEWCVHGADASHIVFVQVRPITGKRPGAVHVWSNANVAENFPDPLCPMVASFVARGYAAYFEGLARVFGVPGAARAAKRGAFAEVVGTHEGRLYYNLTRIREVLALVPGGEKLSRAFATFTGAPAAPAPQNVRQRLQGELHRWTQRLRTGVSLAAHYAPVQARVRRFERRVDAYAARFAPGKTHAHDACALADALDAFLDIRLRRWQDASLADCAAMLGYSALETLTRRWLAQAFAQSEHQALLKGLDGLPSNQPVLQLWATAQAIRAQAPALQALLDEPVEALARRLQAYTSPPEADETVDAVLHGLVSRYIERWGFRSSSELTLVAPTPHEDWRATLELLRRYATLEGEGPAEQLKRQAAERRDTEARLAQALASDERAGTWQRWLRPRLYRLAARCAQGSVRLRERVRFKQALLYTCLRHVALDAGDALVALGRLPARDDVFFLGIDEVAALLRGRYPYPADVAPLVAARRAAFERAKTLEPPDAFEMAAGTLLRVAVRERDAAVAGADARVLSGTAACAGRYQGPAIVLADASQIQRMQPGQVLVTRQTDPGWASAFFLAKGLVVERGGMLSHGAIVAREFGIPAVVGVADASRIVRDGETLLVDGFLGRIERVSRDDEARAGQPAPNAGAARPVASPPTDTLEAEARARRVQRRRHDRARPSIPGHALVHRPRGPAGRHHRRAGRAPWRAGADCARPAGRRAGAGAAPAR
jgi:pyruvate,water dikinase